MSGGGMIGRDLENLPVGFRFQPTDRELIDHYLKPKILGMDSQVEIIPEVDVCKWEPSELPGFSVLKTDDLEWFFFSLLDYKYSNGSRSNRATKAGYWKPTGQDRGILSGTKKEVIGTKKTLVFYSGRGRAATRTNWVIHEYRGSIAGLPANKAYVLCRLKRKTDENTASDIPTLDEAGADTGIHQNGLANNMTLGAGPSHHSSNITSDIGNYQVEEMTLDEELQGLLNDIRFTPPGSDWFSDIEKGRPQSPLKGEYGKGGGSSSNTDTEVLQGFCLQAKDSAEYDSVTDLLQKKNPIRESKKDSKVTEKANRKLSSIWNEPVGKNQKGSFSSPKTASASHEPSSSPGTNQPIITKKRRINEEKHVCFFSNVEIS